MKSPSEQQLAIHYLAHRNGYSLRYVLRQSKFRYAILGSLLLILGFAFFTTTDQAIKGFCLWGMGMFFGAIVRDLGWLRMIKMQWPFTVRIVDWEKVEKIAKGNNSE